MKKGQTWYVTVKPRDGYEYGELVRSASIVVSNTPPVANNVKITPSEPKTTDDLRCEYDYTDIDGDIESGTEIRWFKDGIEQIQCKGQLVLSSDMTKRGDRWQFKIIPCDGIDFGLEMTSSEVIVVNSPPIVNNVIIEPNNPSEGQVLNCIYEYIDLDGDAESGTSIRWYKNEVLQNKYNDQKEIPSGVIKKGESWKVVIRPRDGISEGRYVTSPVIIVGNSPPFVEGLHIEILSTGDLVVRYDYRDLNGDKEYGTEIRWYRNKSLEPAFNDQILVPNSYMTRGDKWYVTVRPSDGMDYGGIIESTEVTIGNFPPMASELTIEPSNPYIDDTLKISYVYSDIDGDAESGTEIRWYRNGTEEVEYRDCREIPSIALRRFDRWYFTVRPRDGIDFGLLQVSPEVTIGNRLPVVNGLMISPANPKTGDQLICSYVYTDLDGDAESGTEIRWYKDEVYQSYYKNKTTISSSSVKKGQTWYVTVKPKDGYEYGELARSASVVIANKPPVAESPRILPSEPLTEDDLICSYGYEDADKDPENGTEIKWYKNNLHQINLDNFKTVPFNNTRKNEKWYFTVKPKDGVDFGEMVTSPEILIGNSPPVVSNVVLSPSEPYDVDKLVCTYDYYDADGDKEMGTTLRWYKNDSLQEKYNDQKIIPNGVLKKGDKWRVVVRPSDGIDRGKYLSSQIVEVLNTPPIVTDLFIQIAPNGDLIAKYTYSDASKDPEEGTEIKWYRNGQVQNKFENMTTIPADETSKGERWYFTVRPKDGSEFGKQKTSPEILIGNKPPTVSKLSINPSNPVTIDDLMGKYEYADEDGDLEKGTEIRWYKNGEEQLQFFGQLIIPSTATNKGEKWHFTVKPKDGTDFGEVKKSQDVIIGNTPPIVKDIIITPTIPVRGDFLECKYSYFDIDGDIENGTEIKWYKDDIYQSNHKDKTTVTSDSIRKGQVWYVVVRPKDGSDFGEQLKSSTVTVANTPPIAGDLMLKPSSPKIDDDLISEYSYTDLDDDPELGTEIKWYKNGILQENLNNQRKVSSNLTSKGEKWYFTVKPKDGENFGELKTSSTITIANSAPIADKLIIIPINPKAGEPLECKWTFIDEDADEEDGSEIRWFKDGIEQKEYYGQTIIPSNITNKGERWHFTVKPKDGTDFGELKTSPSLIIGNTPPVADSLFIITTNPKAGDPLECRYEYYDADGDIESETELKWYKDGIEQTLYSGQRFIPSNVILKNEHWYFTVRPNDGKDFGELKKSPTIIVGNTPPIAVKIRISPINPLKSDALVCEYEYIDKDGDQENGTEIKWYKNGLEQERYLNEMIIPAYTISKDERWYFTVRPKDGTDFGDIKTSSEIIIVNSPPIISNLNIIPSNPKASDSLRCTYTYFDLDDDIESGTEIKWYKDDIYQSSYKNRISIPTGAIKKGQTWYVTVQVKDNYEFGEIQRSPSVIIANSAPIVSDLKIDPPNPLTNNDLKCNYSYNDIDDDPENGTEIRWYKNGILQESFVNQMKIPSAKTSKGEKWHFTVRPKDGFDYGEFSTSPVVIIGNTPPYVDKLSITPDKPTPDDDLVCSYQYNDVDNDPEGETQIRWFKDDQLQSKYDNSYIIPSTELNAGQTWYFTVQPSDGAQFGNIKRSDSIKIFEKPVIPMVNLNLPMVTNLKILPNEPYTNDDLKANYEYFDLDGDPENGTELKWYKNGIHQKDRDNYRIIPSSEVTKGDRWYFTVRPKDGKDFGEIKSSEEVIVRNSPPKAKNLVIIPSVPKKTDNLVCNYVYIDLDNDIEMGTEIRWFKDGQLQPLYNDQRIIPPNELSKGQKWYYTVKPYDGTDFGELVFSNEVTIVNSAPVARNLAIAPKLPLTDDDILCIYEYSDVDNDIEMGTEIRWFKDDQIMEKYNDQLKIPSSDTIKGQKWYFTVRPRDGYLYGDVQKSETVTIRDSKPIITDLKIIPSSPRKSDSLSCHYNYSDPDFDIENGTEIKWIKNGELQTEYDNKTTIPSSAIKKGDKWQFKVRTRYENGFTDWQESLPVIVRNTPPVAVIESDKRIVAVGSPVRFIGSNSYDIDGDLLSYNWDIDASDGINIDSIERDFVHIYKKSGDYIITLIVSDGEAYSMMEVYNLKVEDRSFLVGAYYNIPDEKLVLKFDKPMKLDITEIDGSKICMEIADSGKPDIQIQGKCKRVVNWSSASDVIIDLSNDPSTAFALVLESIIKHHKIDLILPEDLIMDVYGIGNQAVLCSDDIMIEMISDRFKIGVTGDVNGSGTVTNYDAELILNAVVNGIDTLPIYNSAMEVNRWLAKHEYSFNVIMDIADIDRDGSLSSYDASLIMQNSIKLIPENLLNNKQLYRRAFLKVNRYEHQNIDMSVVLNNVTDVYSVDIVMSYDPQKLAVKQVFRSNETSQWLLAYADSVLGKLKISMAGASQPDNGNTMVNICFNSITGDVDMPKIDSIQINGQKFGTIIEEIPKQTLLLQNYPNPCKNGTWIPYQISSESEISIEIYDQFGKLVKRLFSGQKSPGSYIDEERSIYWDCRNEIGEKVTSGIYFYKLKAGNIVLIRKMVVIN